MFWNTFLKNVHLKDDRLKKQPLMLHLDLHFVTAVLHFSTRGDMGIGIMLFVFFLLGHIIDYNILPQRLKTEMYSLID